MLISQRQLDTTIFTARFGQVTAKHVRKVIFAENKSATPCDRTLRRLVELKLLATVEQGRGSIGVPHVYQLGSAGFKMSKAEGSYWQARSVNLHSLAIAEVFSDIYAAQSDDMQIIRYEVDEEASTKINYIPINPDTYLELKLGQVERRVWLEIDLGTERPKQLKDKMSRYHDAWLNATDRWNPWPLVVFVVPDERRKREIESLIALQAKESRPMYRTALFEQVVQVVTS